MSAVKPASECESPESHDAHMEISGECPWCGSHDPDQTEFGSIDLQTGDILDRDGAVIEFGNNS